MKTKQIKRKEAEERNEKWQKLTAVEKLAILLGRPGNSSKQIHRIAEEEKKEN